MSIELVSTIYNLTEKLPATERYGLTSQMRRAAISVVSNISEGSSRSSKVERGRFFEISRSSLVELDTQLEIAKILSFLDEAELKDASKQMNKIFAMLSKLKTVTC